MEQFLQDDQISVCAHRGFTRNAPENSLQAVLAALETGFKAVEIDVRHTKDEELVLMHDETVDRTTNGGGRVDEFSRAEIEKISLVQRGKPFAGIPTLHEVLQSAGGRTTIYVDMKSDRVDLISEAIKKHKAYDWTILHGSAERIKEAHRYDARLRVHTIVDTKEALDSLLTEVRPIMIEVSRVPPPHFLDYVHGLGLPVELDAMGRADLLAVRFKLNFLWKRIAASGVDFIMSNYPVRLRSFLMAEYAK